MHPVVVMGRATDGKGEPRNLRRGVMDPTKEYANVIVPGTEYNVTVTKVLKGNVKPDSFIKIDIGGGSYKIHYYGIIEPFIYQLKDNRVVAVSNIETNISESDENRRWSI